MISSWCYFVVSVALLIGFLRKCRECTWGRCKNTNSLQGRVFIVTGANSGIGKETVKELAKRKATVVMACRNMQNAKNVISEIRHQTPNGELIPMELDLASLSSIREFAARVLKIFPEIHVLINNAGVYRPLRDHAFTEDGFEIHFGVNYLGHFLLTNLLIERLKESAPSRVVIITSKLLESGVIDFSNLNGEKRITTKRRMNPGYCNSKLANVYFGIELAKRMKDYNVNVYMVCPGFAYTGLFRNVKRSRFHYILFLPIALLFLRTANQGAQTGLHCAIEPSLANESGHIYRNCELYKSDKEFDPEVALQLWEVSEKLTAAKETAK
ncbi:retinol dehydrogenase 11-like [Polistes fuscatus]|uniref:retinol dehydrogenase 11-like n=1 Tax=Polistes fuscatus TaxID=30207 RepID=UPI001CA8EDF1|nr:retinol dehydrogenase 11-like [Polistes fuscatus]XP_043490205.1 retinol dehydrogenase 11-like [Polistes fuscatus]XP_043490214.1 retinol dehydrogenase 11-like [Polistes fuscatus]XP_043490221.1 retinol dehydrogenase 11-like [Polistes fuscatus]